MMKVHWLIILPILLCLVSCSILNDQALIDNAESIAQTALAEGANQVRTQIPALKETVVDLAGTQVSLGVDTLATQAAAVKLTAQSAIGNVGTVIPVNPPSGIDQTFTPPYASCSARERQTSETGLSSDEILKSGFSNASSDCNSKNGELMVSTLAFGGKDGSILQPPNQEAEAQADMLVSYTPNFTGNLQVEAVLVVNARAGAAAGAGTIIPDYEDIILLFLPSEMLSAFIDVAEALIFQTAAGVRGDAYLEVVSGAPAQQVTNLVGGRGFGASFPIPPNSQDAEIKEERVQVSLTTPVQAGQELQLKAGVKVSSKVYGWAFAWWNAQGEQLSRVESIKIRQLK